MCGKAGDAVGQTLYTFALSPQTNTYIARKMEGIKGPRTVFPSLYFSVNSGKSLQSFK